MAQKYATRLHLVRGHLLSIVTDRCRWIVPDVSSLLAQGPVTLEAGELEIVEEPRPVWARPLVVEDEKDLKAEPPAAQNTNAARVDDPSEIRAERQLLEPVDADERPVRPPQSALVTSLLRPAEEGTVLLKASAVASYVQREGEAQVRGTGDRFVIGRGPQCDLVIDSPRVSREHAALLRMGVTYLIEDLGSSNGTWFNEQPVSRHHRSCLGPHCYRT